MDNYWSWVIGSDNIRLGFVKFSKWKESGCPKWSWFHSFYIYFDEKFLQFTIFGLNFGLKF